MRFVPRPPARETSAAEDYAIFSARVRREIENALREHRESVRTGTRAVETKEET